MRDVDELKKTPGLSLKRYLVLFIANFIGIYLISFGFDFTIDNFNEVILFIFFISIFNAVLWPFLTKMLMPFFVWTFVEYNFNTTIHCIDYNNSINHIFTR